MPRSSSPPADPRTDDGTGVPADPRTERWLCDEVAPVYDATQADPGRADGPHAGPLHQMAIKWENILRSYDWAKSVWLSRSAIQLNHVLDGGHRARCKGQ